MDCFPFETVRPEQDKLMDDIRAAISSGQCIIAHAPTGLGKTAAALAPAIEYALKNKLTVFFLTSRNTQHTFVMETLREICKKEKLVAVDFVGKKGMCPRMRDYEERALNFVEFCKNQKKEGACEEYKKTIRKADFTKDAESFVEDLIANGPLYVGELVDKCSGKFCAYEISTRLAQRANVIVADYYHLFSPRVRKVFLTRIKKELAKSIVIVDEAHNLPERVRNLLTSKLNTLSLNKLAREVDGNKEVLSDISDRVYELANMACRDSTEAKVTKQDFVELVEAAAGRKYSEFIEDLEKAGEDIDDPDDSDNFTKLVDFFRSWRGEEEGFTRVVSLEKTRGGTKLASLEYSCLHPGTLAGALLASVYSSVLMSGTLVPTDMYRDVLGLKRSTVLRMYPNPFSTHNRCVLISPTITTKYEERDEAMYKRIAIACTQIINSVNGNSAVFFSSYEVLNKTLFYLQELCEKRLFVEVRGMTKEERQGLISRFKQNLVAGGGAIIGVQGASFSEGIDLPGDFLSAVAIVGVPFAPPDLRQKAVINYYEKNFGKGWDYGYNFPAINKALQAAGRCIRSETDKGVIVFLDKRFGWSKYSQVIPPDWTVRMTDDFSGKIERFFSK